MGQLYFVRHGQTIWNVENKICGVTDIALTQKGHEQAMAVGQMINDEGLKLDKILYSPLIRAAETARHISEVTGVPAFEEIRIIEQSFGKYESTARDGKEFHEAKKQFICRYDGGESMFQVAQRIYNLLDDITKDSDKVYMLVAHNGIARVIESYFRDMTNEEFATHIVKNCSICRYDFI